jgi:hypothetical protein
MSTSKRMSTHRTAAVQAAWRGTFSSRLSLVLAA